MLNSLGFFISCITLVVCWFSVILFSVKIKQLERNLEMFFHPAVKQAKDEVVDMMKKPLPHQCYWCEKCKPHFHHHCGRIIHAHETYCVECHKPVVCMKCRKKTDDLQFVPNSYAPYACGSCFELMRKESLKRLERETKAIHESFLKMRHSKYFQSSDESVGSVLTVWSLLKYWRFVWNFSEANNVRHLIEVAVIGMAQLLHATSWRSYTLICAGVIKMIVPKPFFSDDNIALVSGRLQDIIAEIHRHVPQQQSGKENPFTGVRDIWKKREMFRKHPIMEGFHKLFSYLLVMGVFSKLNIDFDKLYTEVELHDMKKSYGSKWSFTAQLIDTGLLTLEKCYQAHMLKSLDPLIHCCSSYSDWYEGALLLKRRAEFLSNPEALGFTLSSFYADLNRSIEVGRAICKTVMITDKKEYRFLRRVLSELEMIHDTSMTKDNACKERKAPFSLLIYGGSNVGKSSFAHQLFIQYGKLFGERTEAKFKYTRSPFDEYWTNFKSYMWCGQFDDVAFIHPDKSVGIDPTLMEVLQVNNNVAYVPNQAALEDKGRTPVLFKLLLATTNTEHLNLNSYFSCPLAVARRFPYIVTLVPKRKYAKQLHFLDPSKLPTQNDGAYLDFWRISVRKVVPAISASGVAPNKHRLEEMFTTDDIHTFLKWYASEAIDYNSRQDEAMESMDQLQAIELCEVCHLSKKACGCGMNRMWSYILQKPLPSFVPPLFEVEQSRLFVAKNYPDCIRRFENVAAETVKHRLKTVFGPNLLLTEKQENLMMCEEDHDIDVAVYPTPILVQSSDTPLDEEMQKRLRDHRYQVTGSLLDEMGNDEQACMADFIRPEVVQRMCVNLHRRDKRFMSKFIPDVEKHCSYDLTRSETVKFWVFCKLLYVSNWPVFSWILTFDSFSRYFDTGLNPGNKYLYHLIRRRGGKVRDSLNYPTILVVMLACYGFLHVTYFAWSSLFASAPLQEQSLDDIGTDFDGQADESVKETRWDPDPFVIGSHELSQETMSWKKFTKDEVNELYARNMGLIRFYYQDGSEIRKKTNRIFSIGGQYWLVNKHAIPPEVIKLEIIVGAGGVHTENIVLTSLKSLTFKTIEGDVAMIRIPQLRARRKMIQHMPKHTPEGMYSGRYLIFQSDGTYEVVKVRNACFQTDEIGKRWIALPARLTEQGECGSVLILNTVKGPFLAGIHCTREGIYSGALALTQNMLNGKIPCDLFSPSEPYLVDPEGEPIELKPLREKSVLNYNEGRVLVSGSLPKRFSSQKSQYRDTLLREELQKEGIETTFAPAVLKSWVPWKQTLESMIGEMPGLPADDLENSIDGYVDDVLKKIPSADMSFVPYTVAINGAEGVKYVDRLKRNTSMGFPWYKPKKQFLTPDENLEDFYHFPPDIKQRIERIWKLYESGQLAHPVFTDCMKDEALPLRKVLSKGTRIFSGVPADWCVVVRMVTLRFSRLFYRQASDFESGCGIDCWSKQWNDIGCKLKEFSSHYGAGDYKKFDKKMESSILLAGFEVIARLYQRWGMDVEEANFVRMIGHDTAFSFHDFDGDLVQFLRSNPSGQPLTIIVNCIVGSLYFRMVYINTEQGRERGLENFQHDVLLYTCGDDNIFASRVDWFSMLTLHDKLKQWNVDYTMADKVSTMVPWTPFNELTFLKRYFVFNHETKHYHGRLDLESIKKSLCIGKEVVDEDEQAVVLMCDALRELFNFGREEFGVWRDLFKRIIERKQLGGWLEGSLPSYDHFLGLYVKENILEQQSGTEIVGWKTERCEVCDHDDCPYKDYEFPDYLFQCWYCGYCVNDAESEEAVSRFVCKRCVAERQQGSVVTAVSSRVKSLESERERRVWTEPRTPPGCSPKSVFTEGQAETEKITKAQR